MKDVGIKCWKCGAWYRTEAHVETKFDEMTYHDVTVKFPRVMLSRWGEHRCETKKKGKYNYD